MPRIWRYQRLWWALGLGAVVATFPTSHGEWTIAYAISSFALMAAFVLLIATAVDAIQRRRTGFAQVPVFPIQDLHPLVAEPTRRLWVNGEYRAAVDEAARNVNGAMQQMLGIFTVSERELVEWAFGSKPPLPDKPKLRLRGDRGLRTHRGREEAIKLLGMACFAGIRNPSAHEATLNWDRAYSFHLLTVLSLFAMWLEECDREFLTSRED